MRRSTVIVGAGLMGRWHARAARRAGLRISAFVDPLQDRARSLAADHRGSRAVGTLAEALQDRPEFVQICTPTSTHLRLAREALRSGAHVLVEKPFAETLSDAQAVLDEAVACGRMAVPVHQFGFQEGVRRALRELTGLGELCHLRFRICSAGAAGRPADEADRIAYEILPHPLSLVARVAPGVLPGLGWQTHRPRPGEWMVSGVGGGIGVEILISMASRPPVNEMHLLAERGSVLVDLFHGYAVVEQGSATRLGKAALPLRLSSARGVAASANLVRRMVRGEVAYPGLDALVAALVSASERGGPWPITAAESLQVVAAHAALRTVDDEAPDSRRSGGASDPSVRASPS